MSYCATKYGFPSHASGTEITLRLRRQHLREQRATVAVRNKVPQCPVLTFVDGHHITPNSCGIIVAIRMKFVIKIMIFQVQNQILALPNEISLQ